MSIAIMFAAMLNLLPFGVSVTALGGLALSGRLPGLPRGECRGPIASVLQ